MCRHLTHHNRSDRGAASTTALVVAAALLAVVALIAGLGWVGVFDSDEGAHSTTTVPTTSPPVGGFAGTVFDSVTGATLAGVELTPTDEGGLPLGTYRATSAADGTYAINGLPGEEHGLWVDGTSIGYEAGYARATMAPFGHPVEPTWGAATTAGPWVFGDVALDQAVVPDTTNSTTAIVTTTTAAGGNQPPTIVSLSASPSTISGCGSGVAVLTVVATDDEAVETVYVEATYTAKAGGVEYPYTVAGNLYRVGDTDTWQGPFHAGAIAAVPTQMVQLKVTAIDYENLRWWRTFNRTLTIVECHFVIK